jgi:hypothetical protein
MRLPLGCGRYFSIRVFKKSTNVRRYVEINMDKKLIVHLGPYKTGTSTIQKTLYNNRRVLLRYGVLYPAIPIRGEAHHNIPWEDYSEIERIFGNWEKYANLACASRILISSEHFSAIPKDRLEKIFANKIVEFFIYKRDRRDVIISHYKDRVKKDGNIIFEEYAKNYIKRRSFRLDEIVRDCSRVGSVKIFNYQKDGHENEAQLFRYLGVGNDPRIEFISRLNVGRIKIDTKKIEEMMIVMKNLNI